MAANWIKQEAGFITLPLSSCFCVVFAVVFPSFFYIVNPKPTLFEAAALLKVASGVSKFPCLFSLLFSSAWGGGETMWTYTFDKLSDCALILSRLAVWSGWSKPNVSEIRSRRVKTWQFESEDVDFESYGLAGQKLTKIKKCKTLIYPKDADFHLRQG